MSQPASLPGTPGPRHRSGTTRDASRHHHQYTSPPLTSPILCNSNDTPRASWYRYNSRKKVDWGPSTETASYTVAKTHALYDDRQTPQPSLGPRTASPDTRVTDPDRRSQQHAHDLQARRSLGIVDELLRSNPSSPPPLYDWILPQPSSRVLEHENAPLSFADSLSDSSNAFSQAGSSLSKEMMILRESSPNARGPPPKSNCAKQIIDRPKRSFNPKSTFRDSAAYIEQLESQLAALQVQVQALASPSTKSSSTKLRALSAESRALRQQVADWESKFNERLSEAKGERAEVEKRLQIRIETMERDADTKIGKVKELEWELESAGKHAEDLQNLEAENVALGRRIDLLTGLLARSPTKLQLTLDTTEATVSQKRPRPRPLSMMPRISYTSDPDSLQDRDDGPETVARPAARHSASYTCSPRRISFEHALRDASRCQDEGNSPSLSSEFLFPAPSSPSTPGLCSSPHSTLDSCSSGSVARIAAWESPLPNMLDAKHKLPARRMMRRFHSGSNAPKALILPTAAHSGSFPMSAPALGISLDHEEPSTPKAALGAQYPRPSSPVKPRSSTDTFAVTDGADVHEETLLTEFQQGRTSTIDDHIESELCPDDEETVQNHEPSLVSRARSVSEPRRSSRRRRGQSFISDLAALISEIWEAPVRSAHGVVKTGVSSLTGSQMISELGWWLVQLTLGPSLRRHLEKSRITGRAIDPQKLLLSRWHQRTRSLKEDPSSQRKRHSLRWYERESQEMATRGENEDIDRGLCKRDGGESSRRCPHCVEPSTSHSLWMWFKFSIALIFAIGVALKDGPGSILGEQEQTCDTPDEVSTTEFDEGASKVRKVIGAPSGYENGGVADDRGSST